MKNIRPKDIERKWHLVDAQGRVVGRLATEVAKVLMGKNKNYYTPYLDTGDYVVVINCQTALLTGKKEEQKKYYRHSGYPGGLYVKTASQMRAKHPENIFRQAVIGMLPKTKLGKIMLKKLFVYPESDFPQKDKFKS